MTNRTFTIIVGAGASKEFGLPIGSELKERIARHLNIQYEHGIRQTSGDYVIKEAIELEVRSSGYTHEGINPHLYAAWRIRDALPQAPSVDQYIDTQRGDKKIELCGKLAIVRSILEAESKSSIFLPRDGSRTQIDFSKNQNCWLSPFFRNLIDGRTADELDERFSNISFVIFNYDRCIEHYLFHALQSYYPITQTRAAELLGLLQIYHPYGSVGDLPWQKSSNHVDFGSDPNPQLLLKASREIKTFTEGTDPESSELKEIRHSLQTAPRVLFLGFAYHPLNMELLKPDAAPDPSIRRQIFGTALGISRLDCDEIEIELAHLFNCASAQVKLRNDLACHQIFHEYTRGLSLR